MALSFTTYFGVPSETLEAYGAFDLSLESDLPVFIDPFLLFNSPKPEYQELHDSIIKYLLHLRDMSLTGEVTDGTLRNMYCFKEVKQNWLGFSYMSNNGSGLGIEFARALHQGLGIIFSNFGEEQISRGSHLEKVSLIRKGVGRDNMSDFTTNLIKRYLLEYTEKFTLENIPLDKRQKFRVPRVYYNYETESWAERIFTLPMFIRNGKSDYVLLTPADMLTRDHLWIDAKGLYQQFDSIPEAIGDSELRDRISNYFMKVLGRNPKREDRDAAIEATLRKFPALLDYYIKMREDEGEEAAALSLLRVRDVEEIFRVRAETASSELQQKSNFYQTPYNTLEDSKKRVGYFKHYIENQDGYQLINGRDKKVANEKDVQLFFGLVWFGTPGDVNREANNGRGPVDYKVSFGEADKSLIEIKLGSNSQLKKNLENQVRVYERANRTDRSIKMIVCYTAHDQARVRRVFAALNLVESDELVVIDARNDNKPSGSKATLF